MNETVGIAHYWSQGDAITHAVAYLLLLMSLVSWYFIISKTWSALHVRRGAGALEAFWKAPTLTDAIALLQKVDRENVYSPLAIHGNEAAKYHVAHTSSARPTAELVRPRPGSLLASARPAATPLRDSQIAGG